MADLKIDLIGVSDDELAVERKDLQLRMQELIDFLDEQQTEVREYSETLTGRLVEKI